jgi:hypothetical protein
VVSDEPKHYVCTRLNLSQFTASMWTPEQSSKVLAEAKEVNPKVKTLAMPQGLQVQKGPDAVVEYVKEHFPSLLECE